MRKTICLPLLLLVLMAGLCSACSKKPGEDVPPSTEQPDPAETATSFAAQSVTIPAPEMGSKPRLSELPDSELMKYMLEQEVDFGTVQDPANNEKTITQTRKTVCEIEKDPYGFWVAVDYPVIEMEAESVRRAVCRYYGWPLVRLVTELVTDAGKITPELQMWSLQKDFFGGSASTTESGVKMLFAAPYVSPKGDGFSRRMNVYLEPADVIREKERAETSEKLMKAGLGEDVFEDGTAVIYDLGSHSYDIYLYLESGRSAVKIETCLTEEELADLLSNSRFFETAG